MKKLFAALLTSAFLMTGVAAMAADSKPAPKKASAMAKKPAAKKHTMAMAKKPAAKKPMAKKDTKKS